MPRDWLFTTEDSICNLRTAGICIRDGRLLVQREADGDEYALLGGHVKIGETLADALIREYREETGASVRCKRLLWSEECFWRWKGKLSHTLCFYYEIELLGGLAMPGDGFVSHRDNDGVVFGWMPLDAMRDITIYPDFIKTEIHRLDDAPKHFVTRA